MKFRKKPVVIEAVQFLGAKNMREVCDFIGGENGQQYLARPPDELRILTLEGVHHGTVGDWVIRGVKGEYYFCKPDIFAETYEPASLVQSAVAECAGPFVDAKDCPVHRKDTLERATANEALSTKVQDFLRLPDNWDSYGARPFNSRTIALATEIARGLSDEWKCVPCADGPSVWFYRGDEEEVIQVHAQPAVSTPASSIERVEVEVIDPYVMDLVREHGSTMTNSEIVQKFLPKRSLAQSAKAATTDDLTERVGNCAGPEGVNRG